MKRDVSQSQAKRSRYLKAIHAQGKVRYMRADVEQAGGESQPYWKTTTYTERMGQEEGCDRAAWPEVGSGYPSRQVNRYPKSRRLKKVAQGTQGLRSSQLKSQRKQTLGQLSRPR